MYINQEQKVVSGFENYDQQWLMKLYQNCQEWLFSGWVLLTFCNESNLSNLKPCI